MPNPQYTQYLTPLAACLSSEGLNRMVADTGFVIRFRDITPALLVPSLIATLGAGRVESVADLCRAFVDFTGVEVEYKSFHERLARKGFVLLMQEVFTAVSDKLILRALRFLPGNPFGRFAHVLIQDGTSFALRDGLAETYPGRFNKVSPAAVEIHATVDLCTGTLTEIALTPDTTSERDALPIPASLAGSLLLADRGYPSFQYLNDLDLAGANYIMRAKLTVRYDVLAKFERGVRVELEKPVQLKEILATKPKETLDLWVRQTKDGAHHDCRLVVFNTAELLGLKTGDKWTALLTNLAAVEFTTEQVGLGYRLRWQVELMFKEWKSYANLHRFATNDASIAEGLIWASLCAAILKRFLAIAAQHVGKVAISTRKAAMMLGHYLRPLLRALCCGVEQAQSAFDPIMKFLVSQGRRAHPDRDIHSGSLQLGMAPAFKC